MSEESVCLSSIKHLQRFISVLGDSPVRNLLRGYKIPDDFPYLWMGSVSDFRQRVPMPFLSIGSLRMENDELRYTAEESAPPVKSIVLKAGYRNLQDDLALMLQSKEVIKVAHHHHRDDRWWVKQYITFTRVRAIREGLAGDFLVCRQSQVFGRLGSEDKLKDSSELLDSITEWAGLD